MLFPTLAFHTFFIAVFLVAWQVRNHAEWRKILLLFFSWLFYGVWDMRFVSLLIISGLVNWGAAHLIVDAGDDERRRKAWVTAGVAINLLILGFFKYYGFFIEQLGHLLAPMGWDRDLPFMQVILPVGISFFTFQGMSYLIDTYKRQTQPATLLDLTLLMSFFPHLVAGPIVRPSHLIPQFQVAPRLSKDMVAAALVLITWGVFKKAVIASELALTLVDPVFFDPSAHGSMDLLLAAYGYAVQIYCDFSAYGDIAIGLAALIGYRFPRNFDQPYRSTTLQEFWRRWHISLSSWLRDYLYIAGFGGSRQAPFRIYMALLGTMVLGGLWHGASWNFIIWGFIHGGVLVAERLWNAHRPTNVPRAGRWLKLLVTFHIVTLAWIFFRCATFADAEAYLGQLFSFHGTPLLTTPLCLALIVLGMSLHFGPADMVQRVARRLRLEPPWKVAALFAGGLAIVEMMRPDGVAPFIYFQF